MPIDKALNAFHRLDCIEARLREGIDTPADRDAARDAVRDLLEYVETATEISDGFFLRTIQAIETSFVEAILNGNKDAFVRIAEGFLNGRN